jgi:hypothetical protein
MRWARNSVHVVVFLCFLQGKTVSAQSSKSSAYFKKECSYMKRKDKGKGDSKWLNFFFILAVINMAWASLSWIEIMIETTGPNPEYSPFNYFMLYLKLFGLEL